jgi:hypothetical protein
MQKSLFVLISLAGACTSNGAISGSFGGNSFRAADGIFDFQFSPSNSTSPVGTELHFTNTADTCANWSNPFAPHLQVDVLLATALDGSATAPGVFPLATSENGPFAEVGWDVEDSHGGTASSFDDGQVQLTEVTADVISGTLSVEGGPEGGSVSGSFTVEYCPGANSSVGAPGGGSG